MSLDRSKLRYWLVRKPQGAMVRAFHDGEATDITKHDHNSWGDVAHTIDSIEAERIEVYDASNRLVRAIRLEELDDGSEEPATTTNAAGQPVRTKGMYDAETERLKVVATLIAEAYKFATGVAWEKMLGLFDAIARKSESTERGLDKANAIITHQALENLKLKMQETGETEEDLLAQMFAQFMAGRDAGAATKSPTNGKAKA